VSSGRIWSRPPRKRNIDFLEHGGILDSKGRLSGLAAVMLLVMGSPSFSMSYGTNEGMDGEIGREGGGKMAATHRSTLSFSFRRPWCRERVMELRRKRGTAAVQRASRASLE